MASLKTVARARLRLLILTWMLIGVCAVPQVEASTVGDLIAAGKAIADSRLLDRNTEAAAAFHYALETLRTAAVEGEEIDAFVLRYVSPDALTLARRRESRYTAEIKGAIDAIKAVTNVVLPALGASAPELDRLVIELTEAEQKYALQWDLEVLRRLERKYGPGSAKLNGIEVLIAYGLQSVPQFGVARSGEKKGLPGPFEVVFAYTPSYITRAKEQARLVSVLEAGLRQYFFGDKWGRRSGKWSWLRPAYTSYGLAVSSGSDDPLRAPWEGDARFGAFFGWGKLKLAWLAGDDQRVLVTQQFQLVPWVF